MRSIIISLLVVILFSFDTKETQRIPFCGFNIKDGFYGKQKSEYITHRADPGDESGIADVVVEIKKVLSIDTEIIVLIAKAEDNCFATRANGKRLLVADHYFLNKVNKLSGTEWGAISIIAHEVGHHVAGFGNNPNPLIDELNADYWSGWVLNKLGSNKAAAIKAIMRFGSEHNSSSHPDKYTRSRTIEEGWTDAQNGEINYSRCEDCEP
jgi:hypothetical protein